MVEIIVACILCGLFGRMGGSGNYPRQIRVFGIPFVIALLSLKTGYSSLLLLLWMGLMAGAISTYWDFLFGYDHFWFHGFMIGLSLLYVFPLAPMLGLWMGLWHKFHFGGVVAEEFGRYAVIPLIFLWRLYGQPY